MQGKRVDSYAGYVGCLPCRVRRLPPVQVTEVTGTTSRAGYGDYVPCQGMVVASYARYRGCLPCRVRVLLPMLGTGTASHAGTGNV